MFFTLNRLTFKIVTQWSAALVKGKTKGGEQLQDVIQGCLTYIDSCTEFWSQEKPICPGERERKSMHQKCSKPRHTAPIEPAQFLLKSLDDIAAGKAGRAKMMNCFSTIYRFTGNYPQVINFSEKLSKSFIPAS